MTEHRRRADHFVPPSYPVDEPPTWRAACSCGWVGPQPRYGIHIAGSDLPALDHRDHAAGKTS